VEATEGDVIILDEASFDAAVAEHDALLVMFHAPWCGHCKKLIPEFKKAATSLLAETSGAARLAMVDATEEKDLAARFAVKGFPHLVFFRHASNGRSGGAEGQTFEGGRTEREMVAWVKKKVQAAASLLIDEADLER
jgi:protein disulfide-isomerase-like protein